MTYIFVAIFVGIISFILGFEWHNNVTDELLQIRVVLEDIMHSIDIHMCAVDDLTKEIRKFRTEKEDKGECEK